MIPRLPYLGVRELRPRQTRDGRAGPGEAHRACSDTFRFGSEVTSGAIVPTLGTHSTGYSGTRAGACTRGDRRVAKGARSRLTGSFMHRPALASAPRATSNDSAP